VALLVFGVALATNVRALNVYTLPDILRQAYGRRVSVPAAIMIVIAWCGIVSAQMQAGARLLSAVLAFNYGVALAAVAAVFVLYTFWGGQLSVIRTDVWQLVLFLGGLLVCVTVAAAAAPDGLRSIFSDLPEEHMDFPVSADFGWYQLVVFYPLIVGLPYLAGPDIYSRVLCARDESTAKRAAFIAAGAIVPVSFLLALLGMLIGLQLPGLAPDAALPTALSELVPIGIAGLTIAGFLAAVMSSADTTLVSAATIFSLNVVGAGKPVAPPQQLAITRTAVLGVGLAAWLLASFQQGIIPSLVLAYTVFVGGVVAPTVASFYRGRLGITPTGAMWAVVVGGGAAVVGVIHDGTLLSTLLGSHAVRFLTRILGPGYPNILPILLSVITLLGVSKLAGSQRNPNVSETGR
jgi:SSS family solute:Na+ symporter